MVRCYCTSFLITPPVVYEHVLPGRPFPYRKRDSSLVPPFLSLRPLLRRPSSGRSFFRDPSLSISRRLSYSHVSLATSLFRTFLPCSLFPLAPSPHFPPSLSPSIRFSRHSLRPSSRSCAFLSNSSPFPLFPSRIFPLRAPRFPCVSCSSLCPAPVLPAALFPLFSGAAREHFVKYGRDVSGHSTAILIRAQATLTSPPVRGDTPGPVL